MANLFEQLSRGEWISYIDHGIGARDPHRGLVHIATIAPQRRPNANEGAANQALMTLAKDHALFARAVTMGVASISDHSSSDQCWVSVGPADSTRRAFACFLDAFGIPALTPELRAALRLAVGIQ